MTKAFLNLFCPTPIAQGDPVEFETWHLADWSHPHAAFQPSGKLEGDEYVAVDMQPRDEEWMAHAAADLVMAAAMNRNMIVYDKDASQGVVSLGLVSLLESTLRRHAPAYDPTTLGVILLPDDAALSPHFLEIPGRFSFVTRVVKRADWDEILRRNNATDLAANASKGELLVAVALDRSLSLVRPYRDGESTTQGLVILDNRKVLLGAY